MYSVFRKVLGNVEDSPHKRVLDVTQEDIDNCVPDDSKKCAVCRAVFGSSKFQNDIEILYSEAIVIGDIEYKASKNLMRWQNELADNKDGMAPIRVLFNEKRKTAKIFKG